MALRSSDGRAGLSRHRNIRAATAAAKRSPAAKGATATLTRALTGGRSGLLLLKLLLILTLCCRCLALPLLLDERAEFHLGLGETSCGLAASLVSGLAVDLGVRREVGGLGLLLGERPLLFIERSQQSFKIVGGGCTSVDRYASKMIALQPLVDGGWIGKQRPQCPAAAAHHFLHGHVRELPAKHIEFGLLCGDLALRHHDLGIKLRLEVEGLRTELGEMPLFLLERIDLGEHPLHLGLLIADAIGGYGLNRDGSAKQGKSDSETESNGPRRTHDKQESTKYYGYVAKRSNGPLAHRP